MTIFVKNVKFFLTFIVFMSLIVNVSASLLIEDGISLDNGLVVYRNPFYNINQNVRNCSSVIFLNITYPVYNQTFYFPRITPNVTYNVSGAVNPICYTATEGNWTTRDCHNGLNWYRETLPRGLPIHLSVWVVDDCGSSVVESIPLYVYYSIGRMKFLYDNFLFVLFLVCLMAYVVYKASNRWKNGILG